MTTTSTCSHGFNGPANCYHCTAAADVSRRIAALQAENAGLRDRVSALSKHVARVTGERIQAHNAFLATADKWSEIVTQRDDLATAYNDQINAHATTEARATAAEGERDRLREALEHTARTWRQRAQQVWDTLNVPGNYGVASGMRHEADLCDKALAAIPPTEGEASAPPKENP